ncbi:mitochondrial metalloendopeptidase OMA1-like [Rhododendron vialii]|uniref:mitochondrial metalloendopeptidase OMA1-like n=1 Tax=Rhododendron vialii TaxID=182163 RepID=UPI00265E32E6|nr:mitochondrial metalloendopeptidase OMA1-like [Rhododendron vialii]
MCLFGAKTMSSRFLLDAGRRFFHGNRFQPQLYSKETGLVIHQTQRAVARLQRGLVIRQTQRALVRFKRDPWGIMLRNPKLVVIGSCVLIALLFGRMERIPISGRFHIVLSCKTVERKLGEWTFKGQEEEHRRKILPPNSPQSIRVQRILREIVQGMQSGLRLEKDSSVRVHELKNPAELTPGGTSRKEEPLEAESYSTGNELVCHKPKEAGIQKRARRFGWRFATRHLDGLNWEVMVVDDPYNPNACYIPNGKIVFFTGLFRKLKSDAEVAAVLGHEVGHGIARHIAEGYFRFLWVIILLILCPPDPKSKPEYHPINMFLAFISRRREMEADYIGMMLMASAGYDPRLAPGVELKIDDGGRHNALSTHPCGRKRAEKLQKAKVMDRAMAIYREVTSGLGVPSLI